MYSSSTRVLSPTSPTVLAPRPVLEGRGSPLVSFARATRGFSRPSLDARSWRPIEPPFNRKMKGQAIGFLGQFHPRYKKEAMGNSFGCAAAELLFGPEVGRCRLLGKHE